MGNTSDISKLDTREREKAHWLSREYEKKIVNNNEGRKKVEIWEGRRTERGQREEGERRRRREYRR